MIITCFYGIIFTANKSYSIDDYSGSSLLPLKKNKCTLQKNKRNCFPVACSSYDDRNRIYCRASACRKLIAKTNCKNCHKYACPSMLNPWRKCTECVTDQKCILNKKRQNAYYRVAFLKCRREASLKNNRCFAFKTRRNIVYMTGLIRCENSAIY